MTSIPTKQGNNANPSDYDWKAPATSEATPKSHSSDYDWKAPISNPSHHPSLREVVEQINKYQASTTTLNFSTGPNGVTARDNHGNEFIQRPGNTPAITCDGQAQGINIAKGVDAAAAVAAQLPPAALAGVLESAAKAGPLPSVSGSVTFEGESPLTALCNAGKEAGILQR